MTPLRILHVARTLHPIQSSAARIIVRMAGAQAQEGHLVRLLTTDTAGAMVLAQKTFQTYPGYSQLRIKNVHEPGPLSSFLGNQSTRVVFAIMKDIDIVHVHGSWGGLQHRTARIAVKRGTPYVVTSYGFKNSFLVGISRPFKTIVFLMARKELLRRSNMIHVLSTEDEGKIRRMGIQKPVGVIPDSEEAGHLLLVEYQKFTSSNGNGIA